MSKQQQQPNKNVANVQQPPANNNNSSNIIAPNQPTATNIKKQPGPANSTKENGQGAATMPPSAIASPSPASPNAYNFPEGYKHPQRKRWTREQLKATDGIIPLQYGTNQFASQQGMTGFGAFRNTTVEVVADGTKAHPNGLVPGARESEAIVPLQYGTNRFASQKGMTGFGAFRDIMGKHIHSMMEEEFPEEYYQQGSSEQLQPSPVQQAFGATQ